MRRPGTLRATNGDPVRHKCLAVLILPTHNAEAGNLRNFLQTKLAMEVSLSSTTSSRAQKTLKRTPWSRVKTSFERKGQLGPVPVNIALKTDGARACRNKVVKQHIVKHIVSGPFVGLSEHIFCSASVPV
jgi:hypothetical protein